MKANHQNERLPLHIEEGVSLCKELANCRNEIISYKDRHPSLDWPNNPEEDIDSAIISFAETVSEHDENILNDILDKAGFDGLRGSEDDLIEG